MLRVCVSSVKGFINKEQRTVRSSTRQAIGLFGTGIIVDTFKHKFSQPTHEEQIYNADLIFGSDLISPSEHQAQHSRL